MMIWYAAFDGIKRMGPFDSQAAAWQAIELADQSQRVHPPGARVWPEEEKHADPFRVSPWSFSVHPASTPSPADFLRIYLETTKRDIERAIVLQEGPFAKSRRIR